MLFLLLVQMFSVSALTSSEAKQEWLDAKEYSLDVQEEHRDAKLDYAVNKTDENQQLVIDTGKIVLHAALDEAEAWLVWKNLEAEEDSRVPDEIKESIQEAVDTNIAKIDALRDDVDGIETQLELGLVFLKMIGEYFELLADVARNTGYMWVHIGNTLLDTTEEYEAKLRDAAGDNEDVLELLDQAASELETARENVEDANGAYGEVVLPGTPLLKFSEGNTYLRAAKLNLVAAQGYLAQAYAELMWG